LRMVSRGWSSPTGGRASHACGSDWPTGVHPPHLSAVDLRKCESPPAWLLDEEGAADRHSEDRQLGHKRVECRRWLQPNGAASREAEPEEEQDRDRIDQEDQRANGLDGDNRTGGGRVAFTQRTPATGAVAARVATGESTGKASSSLAEAPASDRTSPTNQPRTDTLNLLALS
jgi:hypothetical protein